MTDPFDHALLNILNNVYASSDDMIQRLGDLETGLDMAYGASVLGTPEHALRGVQLKIVRNIISATVQARWNMTELGYRIRRVPFRW